MPRRKEILAKIRKAATAAGLTWEFARSGGNHDVYKLDGLMIPIGHHRDFDPRYAEMIYKECEVKLGKGWWR